MSAKVVWRRVPSLIDIFSSQLVTVREWSSGFLTLVRFSTPRRLQVGSDIFVESPRYFDPS